METMIYITLALAIIAIALAIVAIFKKGKVVVRYEEDLKLSTEMRIRNIEARVKSHDTIIQNYELKPKK